MSDAGEGCRVGASVQRGETGTGGGGCGHKVARRGEQAVDAARRRAARQLTYDGGKVHSGSGRINELVALERERGRGTGARVQLGGRKRGQDAHRRTAAHVSVVAVRHQHALLAVREGSRIDVSAVEERRVGGLMDEIPRQRERGTCRGLHQVLAEEHHLFVDIAGVHQHGVGVKVVACHSLVEAAGELDVEVHVARAQEQVVVHIHQHRGSTVAGEEGDH
mmetsp:Transcript_26418/g.66442  ORF Transcript_26418/g.66442 Transcript_26418/m.66442 type:complete len:221 (-) Transcript_26418:382-1044(-)